MELLSRNTDSVAILELTGRFDSHVAPLVKEWMDKTIGAGKSKVVVNLTGVTFVDSTALSMLVQGMKRCREQHGDLILCGMQQRVRMIFELTRLDRAFEVVADEEGALHAFAA
jgi:anti-sigma B factor antagonist